jgi:glycosyltransferase involved in cell wall biosynthesis
MDTASIVIPTYNRPRKLAQCLDSVLRLDWPAGRLEIIVVDDGSAPPMQHLHPRVQILRQANRGPAAARNTGARAAQGRWLVFLDDDCRVEPSWLRRLAEAWTPGEALAARTYNLVPQSRFANFNQLLLDALEAHWNRYNSPWKFLPTNNLFLAREAFLALDGFDESMPLAGGEDREFSARWCQAGGALRVLPERLVGHDHGQTLRQFWRMHYRYGQGAAQLRQRHDVGPMDPGLQFYLWRATGFNWRFPLCQLATTLGFLQEARSSGFSSSKT